MHIPFRFPIPTAPFPNTYPKLEGIQKLTGSSDLNSSSTVNYAFDVSQCVSFTSNTVIIHTNDFYKDIFRPQQASIADFAVARGNPILVLLLQSQV